jgi:hypothetical protein
VGRDVDGCAEVGDKSADFLDELLLWLLLLLQWWRGEEGTCVEECDAGEREVG